MWMELLRSGRKTRLFDMMQGRQNINSETYTLTYGIPVIIVFIGNSFFREWGVMAEKERLYIFHIFRKDNKALFLHPFLTPGKLVSNLEKSDIVGRYGMEPRVEALTMFRNELYREIEVGVKRWLSDVRFIPKFFISSGVFLVAYFIMSFVIRDPLPVLDELAIGLGAAIVTYILIGKRDMTSKAATKKRMDLRVMVDRITFKESNFVKMVESALQRNEGGSIEEVIGQIVEPSMQELGDPYKEEASLFIQMLENQFDFKKLRKEEKILKNYMNKSKPGNEIKNIVKMIESKKLDFPLYAVYKSFKKTVSSLK